MQAKMPRPAGVPNNSEQPDDEVEDSQLSDSGEECRKSAEQDNQTLIGLDYQQDPRPAQLFEAMKSKLTLLQQELSKHRRSPSTTMP